MNSTISHFGRQSSARLLSLVFTGCIIGDSPAQFVAVDPGGAVVQQTRFGYINDVFSDFQIGEADPYGPAAPVDNNPLPLPLVDPIVVTSLEHLGERLTLRFKCDQAFIPWVLLTSEPIALEFTEVNSRRSNSGDSPIKATIPDSEWDLLLRMQTGTFGTIHEITFEDLDPSIEYFYTILSLSTPNIWPVRQHLIDHTSPTIKIPKQLIDQTPPDILWTVYNHGTQEHKHYLGSPTIPIKQKEKYSVIIQGYDPEGLQYLAHTGKTTMPCVSTSTSPRGEQVATTNDDSLALLEQNLEPDKNSDVLTATFAIMEVDTKRTCKPGTVFKGGHASIKAEATNYVGGTTNQYLTFTISP